ncbi:MAG TPA: RNA polymerase sigma factor [Mycobacteriales bacterium]|jgi:RNA polymerase sigma-70 factor (ECF subfamily)
MQAEDPALLARLRSGDQAAFATVVRQWSPAMLRVARLYVRTHSSAEEVVQETWLAVLRSLHGFEGRAALRTWVFRILLNVARGRARHEERLNLELTGPAVPRQRSRERDESHAGGWLADAVPVDLEPETAALTAEFHTALQRALADVPERQRAVVELRDVQGFDSDEVCELLDLTPANQRVLLHRGRAKLRETLEAVMA